MIHKGNALEVLPTLKTHSVQTIVTSPPYWGLRDYDNDEQLGQETTPELFVKKLVSIFDAGRHVLKEDGTLWVNIADTFFGAKGGHFNSSNSITNKDTGSEYRMKKKAPPPHLYLKTGDLCGVPWQFAIAMQKDGWWLKNDIIWHKPNPMPEAVNNRCCKAHEYIFLFTKSKQYYFDADAIREGDNNVRKTDVWTINTSQYKGAHFAVFPTKLPEICIKAGSRVGDTVLDPFMGSGTTAETAVRLGRKWEGVELNEDYIKIIKERTSQTELF